jgi:hypothetical protein
VSAGKRIPRDEGKNDLFAFAHSRRGISTPTIKVCKAEVCCSCLTKTAPRLPPPRAPEAVSQQYSLLLLEHKRKTSLAFRKWHRWGKKEWPGSGPSLLPVESEFTRGKSKKSSRNWNRVTPPILQSGWCPGSFLLSCNYRVRMCDVTRVMLLVVRYANRASLVTHKEISFSRTLRQVLA